jgi:helicase MOV-10
MSGMINCPAIVATGTCSTKKCPHNHAIRLCKPCKYMAKDADEYALHVHSKNHLSTVAGTNELFQCPLCIVNLNAGAWLQHIEGKRHQQLAISQNTSPIVEPRPARSTVKFTICEGCKIEVESQDWQRHARSQKHRGRKTFTQYQSVLDEAEKDKNGLIVEGGGDLGCFNPSETGTLSFKVNIKSALPSGKSVLRNAHLFSQHGAHPVGSGCVSST